jgi:cysteine desulfurase family protein
MIYFDNAATGFNRPPEVAEAVLYAINHFGNAGRSFYDAVMDSSRAVFQTRQALAQLVGLDNPLQVAFTSSATESLNLVIRSLIKSEDAVIATVTDHNSSLRPLYLSGCQLDFIQCDQKGNLLLDSLDSLLCPNTRFLVANHGSNVTGNINDVRRLYEWCQAHHLTLILDAAQTLGSIPVRADMADIICFTGHKGLMGPQGTGGIIVRQERTFPVVKTGGAGTDSFERFQNQHMPDVFECGTQNSHGLHGLLKGVEYILKQGIEQIHERESQLLTRFYQGIHDLDQVTLYGDFTRPRLPVVSLTVEGMDSSDLALMLWEDFQIATRSGAHCAPLIHEHFRTRAQGMVRFSFSSFNTEDEIDRGIEALRRIAS